MNDGFTKYDSAVPRRNLLRSAWPRVSLLSQAGGSVHGWQMAWTWGETRIAYRLIDVRTHESEALIASRRPGDLALAMLATGGPDRMAEIIRRANEMKGPERERVLAQLVLLCGLRRLTGRLTTELKTMGATINIAKNPILRDLVRDGQASIVRIMLVTKFGELPKWVDERLSHATLSDVERWAKKFVAAETLEGVLGKK